MSRRYHAIKGAAQKGTQNQLREIEKLEIRIQKDIKDASKKEQSFSKYLASLTVSSYTRYGSYPGVPQKFIEKQAFYLLVIDMVSDGGYKEWYVNNWRDWQKVRNGILKQIAQKNRASREFERIQKLAAKIDGDLDKKKLRIWKEGNTQHRMRVSVKKYIPGVSYKGIPKTKVAQGSYHIVLTGSPSYKYTWYLHGWKEYLTARKQLEKLVKKSTSKEQQLGFASILCLASPLPETNTDKLLVLIGKALDVKPPSAGNFPAGITKRGKRIWKDIFKTHEDTIKSTDDPKQQWRLALMTYRRVADIEGIKPFKSEQKILRTVVHRAEQRNSQLERVVLGDIAHLKEAGLIVGRNPKRHPGDVGYEKDLFYAGSTRSFPLKKGKLPIDVMDRLQEHRQYTRDKNARSVSKDVTGMSHALWFAPTALRRGDNVELHTYVYFTQQDLVSLFGRPVQSLPTKKLVDVLGRVNKLWVKNRDLAKSAQQMRII